MTQPCPTCKRPAPHLLMNETGRFECADHITEAVWKQYPGSKQRELRILQTSRERSARAKQTLKKGN